MRPNMVGTTMAWAFSAAVTVSSDIDDASYDRFTAVHALFGRSDVIRPGRPAWETLGLTTESAWYDRSAGGVPGLGLDLADTFFLIGDNQSLGMYRFDPDCLVFQEDLETQEFRLVSRKQIQRLATASILPQQRRKAA